MDDTLPFDLTHAAKDLTRLRRFVEQLCHDNEYEKSHYRDLYLLLKHLPTVQDALERLQRRRS